MMRPMVLEFPGDRSAFDADCQYLLGDALLVAPVFTADGTVEYYVPEGEWTSLLDGSVAGGRRWISEKHGYDSVPLRVRPGTVLPSERWRTVRTTTGRTASRSAASSCPTASTA